MTAAMPGTRAGLAALALAVLLPLAAAAQVPDAIADLRERALALVNESRKAEGLDALALDEDAVAAAQAHADDMFARDYYAHESPEGETARDRYIDAGGNRWRLVAENIARCEACQPPATAGRVEELHKGWMNSPGHRANIMSPGLAGFGFGLTVGADQGLYAVQTFAGPGIPPDLAPGEEPVALSPGKQAGRALAAVNRIRDRAGQPGLEPAPALDQAARRLLPPPEQDDFALAGNGDLFGALPREARDDWAALSVLAGACGGCGTDVTAGDIRRFIRDWQDDPTQGQTLTDASFTHMGIALQADGQGRKIAVLVLGRRR